ncbi:MAG: FecR family protein, partial [Gammaproteobacteria bacterium]
MADELCVTPAGHVVSVQGQVEISRAGAPRWQPASLDDRLCANDRVRVEARGRAAIRLANQTIIRMDRGTTITFSAIEPEQRSWIEVLEGALHFISRMPRSLDIRTPFVNAAIEGTELAVSVREDETAIWVYEGQVRATNLQGELVLVGGDSAVAKAEQAPQRRIVVKPRDAVQWALYYPPVVDYDAAQRTEQRATVVSALEQFRAGNATSAFQRLDETPGAERDASFHNLRASMSLSIGDIGAAEDDLKRSTQIDPNSANNQALQAI